MLCLCIVVLRLDYIYVVLLELCCIAYVQ